MLIGYVSDENFVALSGVALEFERDGQFVAAVNSTASGAVRGDIPAGSYRVTLTKAGYGSKRVTADVTEKTPIQFRLLSDSPYGYAWPKWTKAGEKSEFRVHSVELYHISLWRHGWKKELVQKLGCFDEHAPRANMQLTPDGDFTETGVKWNSIGYPKRYPGQSAMAPERSGLYYFHVETASGKFLSFPWVVAPKKPTTKIAVLASTNTWNAYNNFGGRSNYINPTQLPPTPTVNSRQDLSRYSPDFVSVWQSRNEEYAPLSFDRPEPYNSVEKETKVTDPIRGRQGCHLAPAEWRLLGWLEREGFAYDFYADHQLHTGNLDLDAYEVLIISTHPEYWSRAAYDRVKKWVFERGGKLMYLGGNGIDCEVDFLDDATMRCKSWLPNPTGALQFIEPGTGKKFECRFHYFGESPAKLLGVVFTEPGIMTSAPYRVADSSHWIFKGTGLKKGATFGSKSLHERCPGGASGHETDKRSASTPKTCAVVAQGLNADNGGAEIVYHETNSGGAVFSVGSITWPACLLVDKSVSRITRNVLQQFLKTKS
jgi:N,N-dimethylformamidase